MLFLNQSFSFVVLRLLFDDLLLFVVHGILPINVVLDGLNLFEYFCFIFRVVAVEMVVVGFDPMFQHFEHLFPHSISGFGKRSRS